jgi:excisionase family DNA binding protein
MSQTERRWLTVAEVAALLSIHPKTASAWCLTHRLPAARIGGRGSWRIDRAKLEQDLERQIMNQRPAGALGDGAPRARGSWPACNTRGNRERAG